MYDVKVVQGGKSRLIPDVVEITTMTVHPKSFAVTRPEVELRIEPGITLELIRIVGGKRTTDIVRLPQDGDSAYIQGTVRNPDGGFSHGATKDAFHWPLREKAEGVAS